MRDLSLVTTFRTLQFLCLYGLSSHELGLSNQQIGSKRVRLVLGFDDESIESWLSTPRWGWSLRQRLSR